MRNNIAGYYKAKNNHVFVQLSVEHLDAISEIVTKGNQRIHIFEIYPLAIPNLIRAVIDTVNGKAKLVFHVPHMMRDYAVLIRDWNKDVNKPYKITIDGSNVVFSMMSSHDNDLNKSLVLRYSMNTYFYSISTTVSCVYGTNSLPVNQYQSGGIFDTVVKQRYPELFRDECIKKFKNKCPKSILEEFEDDNDIWDWMIENLLTKFEIKAEDDIEYVENDDKTED